jgi:Retrotransposon gag protein/Zinc knuckle
MSRNSENLQANDHMDVDPQENAQEGPTPTPTTALMNPAREPKIPTPDRFSGDRRQFRIFMSQVKTVFKLNASRFPNDESKVLYIGSLLTGDAAIWFEAMYNSSMADFNNYKTFQSFFESLYKDPNDQFTAQREIVKLSQGKGSATAYTTRFLALSVRSGYDDTALLYMFHEGLSDEVKDVLATTPHVPEHLDEFVRLAIAIDNRLFARRQDKQRNSNRSFHRPMPVQTPSFERQPTPTRPRETIRQDGPTPMDLSNLQTRKSLTAEEKQRRRDLNLCLYCGKEGHQARNCPESPKNGRQPRRH